MRTGKAAESVFGAVEAARHGSIGSGGGGFGSAIKAECLHQTLDRKRRDRFVWCGPCMRVWCPQGREILVEGAEAVVQEWGIKFGSCDGDVIRTKTDGWGAVIVRGRSGGGRTESAGEANPIEEAGTGNLVAIAEDGGAQRAP